MYIACVISDDWKLHFTDEKTMERARTLSEVHVDIQRLEKLKQLLEMRMGELQDRLDEWTKKDPSNAYGKANKEIALLSAKSKLEVWTEVMVILHS